MVALQHRHHISKVVFAVGVDNHYQSCDCIIVLSTCAVQLKNAPNFTKVKVNAPIYKGSGGIEPSEERSQKQDKAAHSYAEVGSRPCCLLCRSICQYRMGKF